MGLLFLQLVNYTDKVEVGKDHFEQEMILSVYRFIEEHYKDGELSDLAKELGFDLYWLSRRIKKLTGHTYTELINYLP
jgi:YesN/AraC family two-component response regulator